MFYKFVSMVALFSVGCAQAIESNEIEDSGITDADAKIQLELVCASNFCGNIVDKKTGNTANCGECSWEYQCGDNGISNVCGNACMPLTFTQDQQTQLNVGMYNTAACDYEYNPGWGQDFGTEMQIPFACNYVNFDNCTMAYNPPPCGGAVCGIWYCCIDNPEAGIHAFMPQAWGQNDGGLP